MWDLADKLRRITHGLCPFTLHNESKSFAEGKLGRIHEVKENKKNLSLCLAEALRLLRVGGLLAVVVVVGGGADRRRKRKEYVVVRSFGDKWRNGFFSPKFHVEAIVVVSSIYRRLNWMVLNNSYN